MSDGTTAAVDYVTTGQNTIAIGLIGATTVGTESTFDCAVRLMGVSSVSRVWKTTNTYSGINGSPSSIMNFYYGYSIYYSTCSTNYYQITFDDDRHEWISSVVFKLYYTQGTQQPRNVVIKAKNAEDSQWTTLKEVTGMTWSLTGQSNRIWLTNNKSYNQNRFENFATGDASECYWKLGMIDLRSDVTTTSVPSLSYGSSIEIFKDIEMGEMYPNDDCYTDFTVNPPLPTGISLDPYTGTISGTATTATATQTYTVTAKKLNSVETVTTQFSLTISICTGGRSLITAVLRADSSTTGDSYKLYQGKGLTGQVIASVDQLPTASNLNYGDFCLNHGIYTLELKSTSTGWTNPAGYYLTVDVGEMKFEMGQVYSATSPASITTMFSSFLPFQVEYDDWKVYKNVNDIASNWNAINFDDSTWTVTKAAHIGTSEAITVYIRRDITLDDASNYQVLNVRVKYAGGVVCYFNGRKVARFNLEDNFASSSESIQIHDSTVFSQFHIVLPTVGAVTGKNVIAFEIHRPKDQPSSVPVVFDATGVFGVNDCSLGVDSVINVSGTAGTTIGSLENFFDYTPVTYGYQRNAVGTYLQWTVENLEGTKFNSFALQTVYARTSWGFSLYGREIESNESEPEPYTTMFEELYLETLARGRSAWSVPLGIAGFRQFKHEVDDTASSPVYISAYIFQYCKPSGNGICSGDGEYPAVSNGELSVSECGVGYRGYTYRECTNGILGPVINHCTSTESYDPVEVTITRTTKNYGYEESFKIYEGEGTAGTLVFTQPSVTANQVYQWTVTLNQAVHTIEMTDSYGDGWTSGSKVTLTIGSKSGDYVLSSGSSKINTFIVTSNSWYDLSDVTYPVTSLTIQKGISFSVSPKVDASGINYSVTSGSLPSGLSITSSGRISGTPSTTMSSCSVTVRISTTSNAYVTCTLTFTVFANPTSCSSGKNLVTLERVTKSMSIEESFKIYEGTSTSGSLVYTQPYVNDDRSYTWKVCLNTGVHVIELRDSASNGWSSGSSVILSIGSSTIGTYRIDPDSASGGYQVVTLQLTAPSGFAYPLSSYIIAKDQFFIATPVVAGVLLTFSINSGSLPQGLTLNSFTGVISGTPSVTVSNQAVSIKVSNQFGYLFYSLIFTVMAPPASLFYSSQSIPKLQQASIQPVYSGGPCTFSISSGSLPAGLSINSSTGVISGVPTATSSQQTVTIKAQNAVGQTTFILTITPLRIPSDFIYSPSYHNLPVNTVVNVLPSSIIGDALTFVVTNGTLPSEVSLNSQTGGLNGYVTLSYPYTIITIKAYNSVGFTTAEIAFKVTAPPSDIRYPQSKYFIPVGEPFSASLSYDGDPAVFSVSGGELPNGLSLNSSTGEIEGTPAEYTISIMTITATNDGGEDTVVLEITVLNTPSIQYGEGVFKAVRNEPFSIAPTFVGELVSFILIGNLPSGYQLNSETGEISGTCPEAEEEVFQIQIVNEVGNAITTVSIKVSFFSLTVWIIITALILVLICVIIVLCVIMSQRRKRELPIVKKSMTQDGVVVKKSKSHKNSKTVEVPIQQPQLVPQPMPQPMPQPIQQPMPQPIPQPVPQPMSQPMPQPMSQPIPQPIQQPMPQPMSQPVPQPIQQPMPQPMSQPIPQPIQQPMPQPMSQPMPQPVPPPIQQPMPQPIQQPVPQPIQQPMPVHIPSPPLPTSNIQHHHAPLPVPIEPSTHQPQQPPRVKVPSPPMRTVLPRPQPIGIREPKE